MTPNGLVLNVCPGPKLEHWNRSSPPDPAVVLWFRSCCHVKRGLPLRPASFCPFFQPPPCDLTLEGHRGAVSERRATRTSTNMNLKWPEQIILI